MQRYQFSVVLLAFALVSCPAVGALGTAGDVGSGGVGAVGADGGVAEGTVDGERTILVRQGNDTQNATRNATFEPARIESETLSVGGIPLSVEQGLLTLRNGTLTLFVKRGAAGTGGISTVVTNARFALGDDVTVAEAQRVRRGLEHGALSVPENISHARVALGLVSVDADGVEFIDSNVNATVGEPRVQPDRGVAGPVESPFEVTNISAPENTSVGQSFEVSAQIRNPGNRTGTEEVQYRFSGVVVQRRTVELEPNESRTVTFRVSPGLLPSEPGAYEHGVYAFASNRTAQISLTGGGNASVRA